MPLKIVTSFHKYHLTKVKNNHKYPSFRNKRTKTVTKGQEFFDKQDFIYDKTSHGFSHVYSIKFLLPRLSLCLFT